MCLDGLSQVISIAFALYRFCRGYAGQLHHFTPFKGPEHPLVYSTWRSANHFQEEEENFFFGLALLARAVNHKMGLVHVKRPRRISVNKSDQSTHDTTRTTKRTTQPSGYIRVCNVLPFACLLCIIELYGTDEPFRPCNHVQNVITLLCWYLLLWWVVKSPMLVLSGKNFVRNWQSTGSIQFNSIHNVFIVSQHTSYIIHNVSTQITFYRHIHIHLRAQVIEIILHGRQGPLTYPR